MAALALRRVWTLAELEGDFGGAARGDADVRGVASIAEAGAGAIAPLLSARYLPAAEAALGRGASLLVAKELAPRLPASARARVWIHPHAPWALASLLDACDAPATEAIVGAGTVLGPHVVLAPRVVLGKNVRVDASTVIGRPGFGWATGPDGEVRAIPQLGGVVIEDDVVIGPLCTIDAGTLSPTRVRRGAKLDAQVHVGHNVDIGEHTLVAAQSGFAGSVTVGRGVLVGGQVGIADHVSVGDFARIAAKSGVIGDVPAGGVVAGYPAQPRLRWLRALARLYRSG